MFKNSLWPTDGGFEVVALITFIVGGYLYHKKVDLIRIIVIGAIMGIGLKLCLPLIV